MTELPGRVVGRQQSPRALIVTRDDAFAHGIAELVPTARRVASHHEVRQSEWDLLVATEPFVYADAVNSGAREPAPHLFVISIGVEVIGTVPLREGAQPRTRGAPVLGASGTSAPVKLSSSRLRFSQSSVATEFILPPIGSESFRRLVETDLLPAVRRQDHNRYLASERPLINSARDFAIEPLLLTGDRHVLAALFTRPQGVLGLALPGVINKPVEWVRAALTVFRGVAPDRFERIPGWEERDEWLSASELEASSGLRAIQHERELLQKRLDRDEAVARSKLAAARASADAGQRRLLISQGDDLVDAVAEALRSLGFEVKHQDVGATPGDKLEDLRMEDPDDEAWEALVEVRGYKGGAALSDLMRTFRFRERFFVAAGRPPASLWYIANPFAGQDPAVRPPILSSQPVELQQWADEYNGCAIDTADVFRLLVAVETGRIGRVEARKLLREARHRFTYAAPEVAP